MPKALKNSRIVLGVTGSVAAYKAIDLIKRLKHEGASVTVVMTDASKNFVTPLSLETASGGKVLSGMFEEPLSHLTLPKDADIMLIAPVTANTIAKMANGICDDLLSACLLAFKGKVFIAPAMNWRMYESRAFQRNLRQAIKDGAILIPPEKGALACGEEGIGRMADIENIIAALKSEFSTGKGKDLSREKILVTAGPTREYMDDVRFISNPSSGKMGYAIAMAAKTRGAEVTLISGPSSLRPPYGVKFISVETAQEMRDAVFGNLKGATAVVMAASIADFSPEKKYKGKLKKEALPLSLKLRQTPDILGELGSMKKRPILIGFSAEYGNKVKNAREKLLRKGADLMVFNDISRPDSGFGTDTNKVVLISKKSEENLPLMTKDEAADEILNRMVKLKTLKRH